MKKIKNKKCLNCEKVIDWYSDEYNHLHISTFKRKKFCTSSCSNTYTKKIENRSDKDSSISRVKKCEGCNKEMSWSKDYRKRAISIFLKQKFCSKACADIHGFRYTGKDHPNYRENSRRKDRRGSAKRWTNNVFKRDGYICQKCKASGTKAILHAHHIKSIKDYPKLKWILDNGITLCLDCHNKVHGYKKFEGKAIISIKQNRKSIRVKKRCSSCKVDLFIKPSDLILTSGKNKGNTKKYFYCNKRCMGDHYKIIRVGKGNPRGLSI